ncbi:MAG: hypothetical protein DRN71_05925 [Candidatus Nanohalarchaeota archaeon]|nr:MAG: hypothetical protein DRN71_05925 [Candidatus Nanohaloarchaeota archaeon]
MFSHKYDQLNNEIRELLTNTRPPDPRETKYLLEKSKFDPPLSLKELAKLLELGKHKETDQQFNITRNFIHSEFRKKTNTLRHIAPLYLSSHCIDTCKYCQYSAERKEVNRTRLNMSDLKEELNAVLRAGNRVIEFTLATDPVFTPGKLAEYISETRKLLSNEPGSGILLCSDYLSKEDYELLKQNGLWGMVQWDETL